MTTVAPSRLDEPARTPDRPRPGTGTARRGDARSRITGWVLTLPVVAAVLIVAIYPLIYTLITSVSKSSLGRPFQEWVGVDNYAEQLSLDGVLLPLLRSVAFALPAAVAALLLGLAIALALDAQMRAGKFVRVLLLLPLMTPPVMAGVIWKLMYAPTGGLFNNVLSQTGITEEPFLFLGSSPAAMISVVAVDVWQWTPFCVLLIYAALQTLPQEVYEAAQVDGAGIGRTFRSVTLPLLMPSLITVLLLKLIVSFKVFDLIFIMTSGGPGLDTTVASFEIYQTALQDFNLGVAGAQTIAFLVLVTVVIAPIAALRSRLLRKEDA